MSLAVGSDLGVCDAFLAAGRCAGRLVVVDDSDELWLVGRCELCGSEAAGRKPVPRREPEAAEGDWGDEPWWKR